MVLRIASLLTVIGMCGALAAQVQGGTGRGDASRGSPIITTFADAYRGGQGRGDAQGLMLIAQVPAMAYRGGIGRGDGRSAFEPMMVTASVYRGGQGRGDQSGVVLPPQDLMLYVRALLEGPYDGFFGMHDSLRAKGLIPTIEPYTALGFTHAGGGGGETVAQVVLDWLPNGNVVDWMLLELRSPTDPTQLLATRCALILQNGLVVDTSGFTAVTFHALPVGNYHVALRHRNHLGTMTMMPVSLGGTTAFVDLVQPYTMTYGMDARKYMFPNMLLWAGDVTHDGTIKYTGAGNDRDPILSAIGGSVPTATTNGYLQEDVNMDGQAKYTGAANDRDIILQNIGGSVPTAIRTQQLP